MVLLEICAGSIQSAMAASKGGADRIEFCDNLYEGGTTPSYGSLVTIRKHITIPVHVLVRPRGGDFLYSDYEFDSMKEDVLMCRELGMNGIVTGFLQANGEIDEDRTSGIVELADPLSVTFHRAFDLCLDPDAAIRALVRIGIRRLLTSGQQNSAIEGAGLIARLIKEYGEQITIMPGGGLDPESILSFHQRVKAREYHATLRSERQSEMIYRRTDVSMGGLPEIPEYDLRTTDPEKVAAFLHALGR